MQSKYKQIFILESRHILAWLTDSKGIERQLWMWGPHHWTRPFNNLHYPNQKPNLSLSATIVSFYLLSSTNSTAEHRQKTMSLSLSSIQFLFISLPTTNLDILRNDLLQKNPLTQINHIIHLHHLHMHIKQESFTLLLRVYFFLLSLSL